MKSSKHAAELTKRLLLRRRKVSQTALARAQAVAAVPASTGHAYIEGMRTAALAAIDYGIGALAWTEGDLPAVPAPLLAQTRLAARSGVGVDTVIQRYVSGYGAFTEALLEEIQEVGTPDHAAQELLSRETQAFDHLISTIACEYGKQRNHHSGGGEARRFRLVNRLLDGDILESVDLNYKLERHHIGLITAGSCAVKALHHLGGHIDRQVLAVQTGEYEIWAWFAGKEHLERGELKLALSRFWPASLPLAMGEECFGIRGWRLTHRQAVRAWENRTLSAQGVVPYRDVAVSVAILKDEELVAFLRQSFLKPLRGRHGSKTSLDETLRTYFNTGGNISSTAAALGVSRQTVANRLRLAEARLGARITDCRIELECALKLDEEYGAPPYT